MVAVTPVRLGEPSGRLLRSAFGVWRSAFNRSLSPISPTTSVSHESHKSHPSAAACDERRTPNAKRRT